MPAAALAIAAVALGACTRDELITGSNPPGVRLDAGSRTNRDASMGVVLDGGFGGDETDGGPVVYADASVRPDAGISGRDGGVPDSGPRCACPTVPVTCTMPQANVPVFSPETPAMLEQLFGALACAETSIHAALYETTSDCVVDALEARLNANPTLEMQLVIDDDQCPLVNGVRACELQRIATSPRVSIVDDARSRYMHHKFYVIDDRAVWTGSANMTQVSFCTDHNNSMIIDEPAIVGAFEAEFQRMYTAHQFGPAARMPIAGGPFTLYLGPESPLTSPPAWFTHIIDAVGTASTSVDFMVFALTKEEISDAIVAAKNRGLRVRGVVAHEYVRDPAVVRLIDGGVPVKVDNVHDKTIIIDGRIVGTGSPNWSANSWENDEASLWVDSSTIAAAFTTRFEAIYQGAAPP